VASIQSLITYLDDLLDARKVADYGPNGLQVPGKDEIRTIVTGVTASAAFIDAAAEHGADLLLVHHGLFWGSEPGLTPVQAGRLRRLFATQTALAAYHLPLDAHPVHGNNALLADAVGAETQEAFGDIGRTAVLGGDGVGLGELVDRVREATGGREPLVQGAGPERVRRVAVVTGSGAGYLQQAAEAGCDALLTGEPRENAMSEASELGLHLIAAGHYATEVAGITRLGELLEASFDVTARFVDIPNPV
jgi:dinuclear metal center YbgI/SA1388 family protein